MSRAEDERAVRRKNRFDEKIQLPAADQVLKLLDDVRQQMNLAMLFITHDMRVAAEVCHRVMVMRQGKVVEEGPTRDIFTAPASDYTRALLAAIPGHGAL